jgi:hypothetical protein
MKIEEIKLGKWVRVTKAWGQSGESTE